MHTGTGRIGIVRERLRRDVLELAALLGAVSVLRATGLVADTPLWIIAVIGALATAAGSAAHAWWPAADSAREQHLRLALQVPAMVALVYTTGWGPGLVMALAFLVADTVRAGGSLAAGRAFLWCAAGIAGGQLALALDVAPSLLDAQAAHGLAALGLLGLALTTHRIARMSADREAAEASVRAREQQFRVLVKNSTDMIVVLDRNGAISYVSDSVRNVFGYEPEELRARNFMDHIHPDDHPDLKRFVAEVASRPGSMSMVSCRLRHADGSWRHAETVGSNLLHDPEVQGWVLNTRDVTDRHALEEQLAHRAFHDSLTNLANRALFTDRVEHAVARQARRHEPVSILFLDLDGFKNVNDTLGHAAGDELIVAVAERLRACARDVDTVARLGGDEFAILLEDVRDGSGPARVADRILRALADPICLREKPVRVSASIGIAVAEPGADASSDELLRNADIAMYMAKASGKSCYEIFEPSMHVAVVQRLEMEADLARAIAEEEFVLHYQPIVALDDQRISGVEALVRWHHPDRGMIPPGDFIPVAEETGMIVPLGHWVLQRACAQAARWQAAFRTHPPLSISVNLSPRQLLDASIVDTVREALSSSGIPPETLTLEITETALVQDTELTIERLTALKRLGVRLAIDDFGTGYSSLSYLQRFPVDVLKIDRSFIDAADRDANPALVRAIVELGRTLELDTVAEGIERNDQLHQFKALQCRLGQGYLFARPAAEDEISALFERTGLGSGPAATAPRRPTAALGSARSPEVPT
jgi:diguanylate cyclase (GGDEF)-like protein/PAS domain S-box-containing protein